MKCLLLNNIRGTRWCNWLRHSATSRKVAFSIPMVLELTQSLTEKSTWNISWD